MLFIHGPKYMHPAAIGLLSCAKKTTDNRFPKNDIRIRSRIKCKQMTSVNVMMVDHVIITAGFP